MGSKDTYINIMDAQMIIQKANTALTEIPRLSEQIEQSAMSFEEEFRKRYDQRIKKTINPDEKEKLSRTVVKMLSEIGTIEIPDICSIIREIADPKSNKSGLLKAISKVIKTLENLYTLIFEKTEVIENMDSTFQMMMEGLSREGDKERAAKNSDLAEFISLEVSDLEKKFDAIFFSINDLQQKIDDLRKFQEEISRNYEEVSYQVTRISRKEFGQPISDTGLIKQLTDLETKLGLTMDHMAQTKQIVTTQIEELEQEVIKLNLWKSQLRHIKDAFEEVLRYWNTPTKKPTTSNIVVTTKVEDHGQIISTLKKEADGLLTRISLHWKENQEKLQEHEVFSSNDQSGSTKQVISTDPITPQQSEPVQYPPVAIAIAVLNVYTYKNGRAFETIFNAAKRAGLVSEGQREYFKTCLIEASECVPPQLVKTQKIVGFQKKVMDIFMPTDFGQRRSVHLAKRIITPDVEQKIKICYREDQEKISKTRKQIHKDKKKKS